VSEAKGNGAYKALIPIDPSVTTINKSYEGFEGILSMTFCANLWFCFTICVHVKLVTTPLKRSNDNHNSCFDLVYEFVTYVVDYDKLKMTTKVSKIFDTIM